MSISPIDAISFAFQHTKRQLFQPFRFGEWTRLAFVGLLAGEMGSSGNFPSHLNSMRRSPPFHNLPGIDFALLGAFLAFLLIVGFVFALVVAYISSVMRFVLFDSVLTRECHIRQGWSSRQSAGWKYFLWNIGYFLVVFAGVVFLFGVPAAFAFAAGWFHQPHEHVLGLVLGGIFLFFIFVAYVVIAAVVQVLTKDFVVPQMALEGIGPITSWRRLWPMIEQETGSYVLYIVMKIVLAIGAGILVFMASLILFLFFVPPVAGIFLAAIVGGKAAGLTWNAGTITLAIVVGCMLLAVLLYLLALITVPVIVFFPAYSIYFFAARYPNLNQALFPTASPYPGPAGTPPLSPAPAG